jgi:mannose-6-phosphate isomerase-like protein (cupin superfamily)
MTSRGAQPLPSAGMRVISGAGAYHPPAEPGRTSHYVEQLKVTDLSFGTYSIVAGGADPQTPHTEDEVYVVTRGRARLVADSGAVEVGPGSVVYVPAGEAHRFVDVTEDLAVPVLFAPAEYARS